MWRFWRWAGRLSGLLDGLVLGVLALVIAVAAPVSASEFLHPSAAFKPSVRALDGQSLEVRFEIAKGYYLYRDNFRFATEPATALGAPLLPPGREKLDETFGRVQVYYGEAVIRLPVERASSGKLPLALAVTSQGCAEGGVCYPPFKQTLSVELPDPATTPAAPPPRASEASARGGDEAGRIAQTLAQSGFTWAILSFFGFGLLLSLTPCVFPMVPILSGILVGAGGERVSTRRGFSLSLAYVLGMAATYAAVGVAAGKTGTLLSSALQNAWVLGAFSLVFVVLAFSMFGFYELQLPAFVQQGFARRTARQRGSISASALMGALSSLVAGPCVAAPLAGALLYIGRSGDALFGGVALFCLALGMGVPLLVVGLSAGTLLPRAGPWMEKIRHAFGFILLATALWFVSPLVPVGLQMGAWALLLIIPAIGLHAIDPLPVKADNSTRLGKAIGVVMLIAGAAMLVGALSGARDPLQPLAGLGRSAAKSQGLSFERVRTLAELESRISSAGRPVMLDFYADWCVTCKEMERDTFADARVQQKVSGWTLLQADVTANSDDDRALLSRFRLYGPPGIIFFDAKGGEVGDVRVVGFQNPDAFLKTLALVAP